MWDSALFETASSLTGCILILQIGEVKGRGKGLQEKWTTGAGSENCLQAMLGLKSRCDAGLVGKQEVPSFR